VARRRRRELRQHRRHRGVAEDQLAVGAEQRDGVLEVLDDGLEVGGGGERLGARLGQLRADGGEGAAEVLELGPFRQLEADVQLAASETRQAIWIPYNASLLIALLISKAIIIDR
jgi:hypothetical protein